MCQTAEVKGSKIEYNNRVYQLAELQTEEVYTYANENAQKYAGNIDAVNEIFLKFILPIKAVELFVEKNNICAIKIKRADELEEAIVADASEKAQIKCSNPVRLKRVDSIINFFQITGSAFYLLMKQFQTRWNKKNVPLNENFAVIRTPASRKKFSQMEELFIVYENYNEEQSLYRYLKRSVRYHMVLKAAANARRELHKYEMYLRDKNMINCSRVARKYYGIRVVHTLFYRYVLEHFFSLGWTGQFYTGNNLDRFAINEERIAEKNAIKICCIPHGLEYGFKLPHCFVGDTFFATSLKAAQWLNELYHTQKFIYDETVVRKMYYMGENQCGDEKKVVFLTEPREVYVNLDILRQLTSELSKDNILLYIKLHPKDQKENYIEFEGKIAYIEELDQALTRNICISRKSTTLLEALYNDSEAAAIITTAKDKCEFNTFISLQDEKIEVFEEVKLLADWIKKGLKGDRDS